MDNILKQSLNLICSKLIDEFEAHICYNTSDNSHLLGHCMAVGLQKANFRAFEVTGNLILKSENKSSIVFGNRNYKGYNTGQFHTWCLLEHQEKKIIIDPSLKYNKIDVKKHFNITLHKNIPDIIILDAKNDFYQYIEDKTLAPLSKKYLNQISLEQIVHLSNCVRKTTNSLFEPQW